MAVAATNPTGVGTLNWGRVEPQPMAGKNGGSFGQQPAPEEESLTPEAVGEQTLGLIPTIVEGQQEILPPAFDVVGDALTAQPQEIPGMTPIESEAGAVIAENLNNGGLTPIQEQLLGIVSGQLTSGMPTPAAETQALDQIRQLTGGEIGSSPATLAALDAFKRLMLPTIQNEMGLAGLGRSGAMGEAVATGMSSATLPLIQQEISNRMGLIPQLLGLGQTQTGRTQQTMNNASNIGTTQFGQGEQAINNALGFGAVDRGIQTQESGAVLADLLRRTGIAQGVVSGPGGTLNIPTIISGMFTPRSEGGKK